MYSSQVGTKLVVIFWHYYLLVFFCRAFLRLYSTGQTLNDLFYYVERADFVQFEIQFFVDVQVSTASKGAFNLSNIFIMTKVVFTTETSILFLTFGFLPTSLILQCLALHGTILSRHFCSQNGNWMQHVYYESLLQAKKALTRNGKVTPDNIMVGVFLCIGMVRD